MITKKKPVEKQKPQQHQDLDLSVAVASNNQLIAATPISAMTTTSISTLPPPPPLPPSTSSSLDFFHSKNSKILSNALSNLTAAIVPTHVASSSSSMKLLNDVIESTRRNAGFVDSIKKSFLSSATEKRKGTHLRPYLLNSE